MDERHRVDKNGRCGWRYRRWNELREEGGGVQKEGGGYGDGRGMGGRVKGGKGE